jgi:hypothetical protein
MSPRRSLIVYMALAAVAVLLSGWLPDARHHHDDHNPTPAPGPVDGTAAVLLDGLAVAPEADPDSYARERFGAGWATGPDGCDTRTAVLVAESLTPAAVEGCTVVGGEWISVYDAARVTDPTALDVDHLVPLAEAWTSGADRWSDQQRRRFANDLDPGRPDALVAVTARANRAKGDSDPAEWMPPNRSVWCRYATAWVTQKAAWHLAVDPAEHQALADALATCPGEVTP